MKNIKREIYDALLELVPDLQVPSVADGIEWRIIEGLVRHPEGMRDQNHLSDIHRAIEQNVP